MRAILCLVAVLGLVSTAGAQQSVTFEPPNYAPGLVVGQDNWTCCVVGSDSSGFAVDNVVFSPMGGSTQALKISGVNSGNRIARNWPVPVNSGVWRIGYDWRYTGNDGVAANMFMATPMYRADNQQIMQPYMNDGDNGGTGGAAVGAFTCTGPLQGGGFVGRDIGLTGVTKNTWYRLEMLMDFDQKIIMDLNLYNISTGSKVLLAHNPGTFYFNYVGGAYVSQFDKLGVRLDVSNPALSWWIDNYTIEPATLPALDIKPLASTALTKVNVPYQQQMETWIPGEVVNWTLDNNGGTGATINANGLISGWTPTPAQVGSTFPFAVTGQNARGTDSENWQVKVIGQYDLGTFPYDGQINVGAGDTYRVAGNGQPFTWVPAGGGEPDAFGRMMMGDAYWYSYVYLNSAGYPNGNISSCWSRLTVDLRLFHSSGNYGDGPVFLKLHSANGGVRDYNLIFGTGGGQLNDPAEQWVTKTVYLNNPAKKTYTDSGSFDPAQVVRVEFWGTNWGGNAAFDYTDFNNLSMTNEPLAPVLDPVTPNPSTAFAGQPYSRQLTSNSCEPMTWTVLTGPAGLTVSSTGLVSGWTPTLGQIGSTVNMSVQATNVAGTASVAWSVLVKPVPVADSGIAQPWGTVHANIGGTQSSNAPSLIMSNDWENGAVVDWTLNTAGAGLNRPFDRVSSITFDEAGNLYWKTADANGYLASVTPTGTLRWIGNVNGTSEPVGSGDKSSPVVGDQGNDGRVYVLTDSGAAAFAKSNGDQVWSTALPGTNFAGTADVLTPVLYGGKLYVLGAGTPTKTLYQLNSTTGAVEWSSAVAGCTATQGGQMALVPNGAGAGKHYLYYNATSGTGSDGLAEMFAILVDTTSSSASLAWSAEGGHVSRSHVIDVPAAGRVCTHTWRDHGSSIHCWNYDGTAPSYSTDQARDGHGFEDFGSLDFNGTDVIAGGFEGRLARYSNIAAPGVQANPATVAYDAGGFEAFAIGGLAGQNGWNGYDTAPEIVADPTGGGFGNVLKLQAAGGGLSGAVRAVAGLTGPIVTVEWDQYRTDLTDTQWLADRADYGNTWWAYRPGGASSVLTANYWESAGATLSAGVWQHVKYTFNLVEQSVSVEVDGGAKAYSGLGDGLLEGIDFELEGNGGAVPMYIDNIVVRQGPLTAPTAFVTSWYKMDPDFGENRGSGGLYQNASGDSIYLAGTSSQQIVALNVSANTPYTVDANANPAEHPRLFEVDSGSTAHPTGGPLLGPTVGGKQRIYYFAGGNDGTLTALTPVRFAAGDFNTDGYVNRDDFILFLPCALGAEVPQTDPSCARMDIDGDGDVDADDFGAYQQCFSGDVLADVDCYP